MAIRVLLDHGVKPDHIIFVTFLVARTGGVSVLNKVFPEVTILCAAVDDELREISLHDENGTGEIQRKTWVVEPGMGQIGTRHKLSLLSCWPTC